MGQDGVHLVQTGACLFYKHLYETEWVGGLLDHTINAIGRQIHLPFNLGISESLYVSSTSTRGIPVLHPSMGSETGGLSNPTPRPSALCLSE